MRIDMQQFIYVPGLIEDVWMKASAIGMLIGLAVRFMVDWGVI